MHALSFLWNMLLLLDTLSLTAKSPPTQVPTHPRYQGNHQILTVPPWACPLLQAQQLPLGSLPTSLPPSTLSSLLYLQLCSLHTCLKSFNHPWELSGSSSSAADPGHPHGLAPTLSLALLPVPPSRESFLNPLRSFMVVQTCMLCHASWPSHTLRPFSGMSSHHPILNSCESCPA